MTALVIVAVLVGGFAIEFSLEATTTDEFCVSCHEMEDNISGADEERLHLAGSGELHGSCADCHLPKPFLPRLRRKLRASAELYHHLLGTLDSPESFEARRLQMAQRVWSQMKHNDSVECRSCHDDLQTASEAENEIAREYHERADENGVGCIDCHKGAHPPDAATAGKPQRGLRSRALLYLPHAGERPRDTEVPCEGRRPRFGRGACGMREMPWRR